MEYGMVRERRFLFDPKREVWIDRETGEVLGPRLPVTCRTCGKVVLLEEVRPPYPEVEYYCSWECYSNRSEDRRP